MAKGFVAITVERCKGCAFCVEFCPTKVLTLSSAFNSKGYHPPFVAAPEKSIAPTSPFMERTTGGERGQSLRCGGDANVARSGAVSKSGRTR